MTARLVIKQSKLEPETNLDEGHESDVIVSSPEGIDPSKELVIEMIEITKEENDYSEYLERNQKALTAYDIKLLDENGIETQPDGTLIIKILIPEELRGKEFSIMHIHSDKEKKMIEYTIEGDYAVIHIDELSEFVFVYERISLVWIIVVLAVMFLINVALFISLKNKTKKSKELKLASFAPVSLIGIFISEIEFVILIVLSIVVITLSIVNIIYALRLSKNKKTKEQVSTINEEEQSNEENNLENEDKNKLWNELANKYGNKRNIKGFAFRLAQSNDEVKNYYDIVKNELLSYKDVKSKVSFKHEVFKIRKNILAKLKFRGKTLCVYLNLNPQDYENTKYKVEDMSEVSSNTNLPAMYRVNLPRRAKYVKDLISDLMKKMSIEKIDKEFVKYSSDCKQKENQSLLETVS